jgi:PTS system nitrogen regulatory IIA component
MNIKEFLSPADVIVGLRVSDKSALLRHLAARAATSLELNADGIGQALLAREQLGSTGVGGGVAVPHARIAEMKQPFGILASIKRPIAFDAVDLQPVDLVFLLLLPTDPAPEYLRALASVARALRDPATAAMLRRAGSADDAYQRLITKRDGC